ncbi:hypothetical protein B0O99DRAFT_263177 [Bisporella sp. PMI_857]|nr:hypothetical protein B0O99DRAFT_263177 [Bisporella sp. PMI_857]
MPTIKVLLLHKSVPLSSLIVQLRTAKIACRKGSQIVFHIMRTAGLLGSYKSHNYRPCI